MNEQRPAADTALHDDHQRLVKTFDSIWFTFSEIEKAEYRRLERNVYAFLPAYYVAADNLHKLRCDQREWWFSTDTHFRYLWPVPVVVSALLLSIEMNRATSWLAVGVVFLLYSLVLVDELKRTRISRLMDKWHWREKEIRAHLVSFGMTSGLLDKAWQFHQRETRDYNLDRESLEYMEFHLEIQNALLDAVRPSATLHAAMKRFVTDNIDSRDSPF
jgi:hypothetical protein